jgi:hypothetical protein
MSRDQPGALRASESMHCRHHAGACRYVAMISVATNEVQTESLDLKSLISVICDVDG